MFLLAFLIFMIQFLLGLWMIASAIEMQALFKRYKNTDVNRRSIYTSETDVCAKVINDASRPFGLHTLIFFASASVLSIMGLYILAYACAFRTIELPIRFTTYQNNRNCVLFKSVNFIL